MSGSAVRIGVGTRFQYDGEMVTVTSEGLALVETVTAFLERTPRTSRATLTRLPASVAFSRRPRRDRAQR